MGRVEQRLNPHTLLKGCKVAGVLTTNAGEHSACQLGERLDEKRRPQGRLRLGQRHRLQRSGVGPLVEAPIVLYDQRARRSVRLESQVVGAGDGAEIERSSGAAREFDSDL